MAPSGTREGPFVVFKGWDIPGFDVSSQPHLSHNVDKLKAVALNDRPALITAFNSYGWLKSCNYLDRSAWREAPGCDLYIRVEYPGWRFIQGLDSEGNDLTVPQIPYSLGGIALLVDTLVHYPQELSDQVAGFNTNGWVKATIRPQNQLTRWSDDPLNGLYIREEFRTYTFFPKVDSEGGDIASEAGLHNNIPALITITNSFRDGAGFNTNGWIKRKLELPPRDGGFTDRHTGTYVRVDWPGYTFLPMLDSPSTDAGCLEDKQVWELIEIANKDPKVVAFNTNGWLKNTLTEHPHVVHSSSQRNPLFGLYVKTPNLQDPSIVITSQIVEQYAFALQGQALIWAEWYLGDPNVPKLYLAAVQAATTEIHEMMRSSRLTPREAAERLLRIRTHLFGTTLHGKNAPPHRLINPAIKLFPGLYTNNIYRVSQGIYHRDPIKLAPAELSKVVTTVFDMASRSGLSVSASIKGLGPLSQIVAGIAAAVSIYQPLLREQWQPHIGSQVFMWSRSVSIGNVLPGVGLLVNPIGAILGGLAGWLTRECNDFPIANWFFGGSSDAAAVSILGSSLEKSQKRVQEIFKNYNCSFYVQRISSQTSTVEISTVESATSSDNLIVTIIWLKTSTVPMPINIANPIDFNNLHFWLVGNLPLPGDAVNYVLGQGTEWHKQSVNTDTLSTESVTVINSATTPTTTSFVPSIGFTRPTLPSLPSVSLSNVGEALLGVGIGGPLLAGGFLKHSHSSENDNSANQAGISIVTTDSTLDGRRHQDSFSSIGSASSNMSSATQDSATTSVTTTWSSSSHTEEKKQESLSANTESSSSSSRWGFKKPKSPLPSPGGMFSSLKGAASEASSRIKGAASDVSGRVADAQGRVMGAATDVTGRVVGTASSVGQTAYGAASNVGSNVYGAASNVSSNVQGRVTDTRESLSRHASEAAVAGVGLVVAGGVVVDQIFKRGKGDKGGGSSTTHEEGTVIHSDQGHSTHEESVVYGAAGGQTTITKDTTTYGTPIPGGHTSTVVDCTHALGTTAEGGRTESQSWSQSSHTEQSTANSHQQSSSTESHSTKQYAIGGGIGGSLGGSLSTIGSSTISGAGSQVLSAGSKTTSTLSGMFGSSSSSNTLESSQTSESHSHLGSLGQAITVGSAVAVGGAVLGGMLGHHGETNETTVTTTYGNVSKGSQEQSSSSKTGYAAGGRTESYSSTHSSQGAVNQTSGSSTTEKHTESSSSAFRSDQKVFETHTDTRITTVSGNGSATESSGHSFSTGAVIGSVTSLGDKLFGGKKGEVKQETSTTVTYGNVATGAQNSTSETRSSSTTVVTGSGSIGSQIVQHCPGPSTQYGSSTSASSEKHASEKHTGSSTSTSTTTAGHSTGGHSSSQSEHTHGHSLGSEIAVGAAIGAVAAIGAGVLHRHKDEKDTTTIITSSTIGTTKDNHASSTSVTNTQSSSSTHAAGASQNVQGSTTESHQTSSTFGSSTSSSDQRASFSRTSSSTTQQVSGSQQSQTGGERDVLVTVAMISGKAVPLGTSSSAGDSQAAQTWSSTSESRQGSSSYGSSQTSSSTSQATITAGETSTESRQGSSLGSTVATTVIGGITAAGVGRLFGQSGAKDSTTVSTEVTYGNISNSATSSAAKTTESHGSSSTASYGSSTSTSQQQSGSQQSQSDDVTVIHGARLHGRPVDVITTVTSGLGGKVHDAFESTTVLSGSSTSSQQTHSSSESTKSQSAESSQTTVVRDTKATGKGGFFSGIKGAVMGTGAVGTVVETVSNTAQSTVAGGATSITSTVSDTVSSVTSGIGVPDIHRPHLPSVSIGRSSGGVVTRTESSSSGRSQQSSESHSSETSQSTIIKDEKESHKHGLISGLAGAALGAAVGGALVVADMHNSTVKGTKESISGVASSVTSAVTDGSVVVTNVRVPEIHRPHLSDVNLSFGGSSSSSVNTSSSSQSTSATESHSTETSQTTTIKDGKKGSSRFDILSHGGAMGASIVGGASSVVDTVSSTVSSTKDSVSGSASSISSTFTDGVSTITSTVHRPQLTSVSIGRGSSETVFTGTTSVVNTADSSSSSTSQTTVIQDAKQEDHKHGLITGLAGAAIGAAAVGAAIAVADSVSNTAQSTVKDAKHTVTGAASTISSTVTDGVSTVTSNIHLPDIHRPHLPSFGSSQSSDTVITGTTTVVDAKKTSSAQQSSESHSSSSGIQEQVSGSYGYSIGISGGSTSQGQTSASSSQTSSTSESNSSESSEVTVVKDSKKEGSRFNIFSKGTAIVGSVVAVAGSASSAVQSQVSDARNRVTNAASSTTTTISDGVSTVTSSVITGGKAVGSAITSTTEVAQNQQSSETSASSGINIVRNTETVLQNVSSSATSEGRSTLSRIGSAMSGVLGHEDSSTTSTTTAEKHSASSTGSEHHHTAEIALGVGAALAAGAVVAAMEHHHGKTSTSSEHTSTETTSTAESTKVSGGVSSSHSGGLTVITTGTTSGGAVSATTGSLTATTTTWTTDTALTSAASDSTQVFSKDQSSSTIISSGKTAETETSATTTTSGSSMTETGTVSSKKGFKIGSWLPGKGRPTVGSSASSDVGGIVTVGAVTTVVSSATGGESSSNQTTTSSSQNVSSETHTSSSTTEESQSASSTGSKVIGSVTTIIGGLTGNTVVTSANVKDTTSATEESKTSSSLKKSRSWLSGVGAAAIGLGAAGAASATGSVGAIKDAVSSATSNVTENATSIAGSLHHHDSYSSTTSQQQESSSSATTEQSVSSSESTSTATEKHHHGIDKTKVAIGVAAGAAGVGVAILEAKDHLFGKASSSNSNENQTTVVTSTVVTEDYSDSSKISWSKESLQSSYSTKFFSFSQTKYHKEVTELSYEEFSQVIIATINSSFSSSSYLSSKLQGLSVHAKAEAILDTVLTSYRPLLAVEWHAEFEKQIEVWKTVVKTKDFSGTAKFKGAVGAAFFGLIAWAFWGLVEKTEETSLMIEWFFGGRSRETAAVVLGSSLKLKQDRVYKLLVKTNRIFVVERVVLKYYILDEEEEGPEEVLATIVWVLAGDSAIALNVGNQADLMFLLNWLAHTKPASQPGQAIVTPSAKLLAPPHKGLLARLAEHKEAALAGAAIIAAVGVAGAVEVADHLKSHKDSLVEKASGGVSEARTRIGGLVRK